MLVKNIIREEPVSALKSFKPEFQNVFIIILNSYQIKIFKKQLVKDFKCQAQLWVLGIQCNLYRHYS